MHFFKGLLIGSITGGLAALLTAKKTGPQRQQAVKATLDDYTKQITAVNQSASDLQQASQSLAQQLKTSAVTTTDELSDAIKYYSFEAKPRLAQINESLATLQKDLVKFNHSK